MDLLYRNGTIKLHGAKLIHGFEHPVILTELEETKKINGNDFELLPTHPRHVTMLKLPPNFMNRSNLLSCEISEIESKQNNWTYLCSGDRNIIGFFKFLENDTNKKFKDSILLIEQQRTENKNRAVLTMSISTLLPVLFYALLSTILFCLIKIFRYVILTLIHKWHPERNFSRFPGSDLPCDSQHGNDHANFCSSSCGHIVTGKHI